MKTRLALIVLLCAAAAAAAAAYSVLRTEEPEPRPLLIHAPGLRVKPVALPMPPDGRNLIEGFMKEARKHAFAGEYAKGIENAESALKCMFDWGLEDEAAEFRIEVAGWYVEIGNIDRGAAYLTASYVDGVNRGGPRWTAIADKAQGEHVELAFRISDSGKHDDALRILEMMLREFRKRGNRFQEAQALHNQAWVISDSGAHERALEVYAKALAIRREIGDEENAGWTLNNMGYTLMRAGRHADAAMRIREALEVSSGRFGHLWRKAVDNDVLNASASAAAGQTEFALARLRALSQEVEKAGLLFLSERVLFEIAMIARNAGLFDEALAALARLVELEDASGYPYGKAAFLLERGKTLSMKGDVDAAMQAFEAAVEIQERIGALVEASWTRDAAGRALSKAGRRAEALERYAAAKAGFESAGPFNAGIAQTCAAAAADLEALGRPEEAASEKARASEASEAGAAPDLERVIRMIEVERRGPIVVKMAPSGTLMTIRRVESGWIFHDSPVDSDIFVPFGWAGRHVTFQGKDFRVEGGMLSHEGFQVYLPVGSAASVSVGGDFARVR